MMNRPISRLVIIAATVLVAQSACCADFYVQAGVDGGGFTNLYDVPASVGSFADYWNKGVTEASAEGSFETSSASASISLSGPQAGIHLSSHASTEFAGQLHAAAGAQWRDTLRVSDPNDMGRTLRVYFEVTGSLYASTGLSSRIPYGDARVFLFYSPTNGNSEFATANPGLAAVSPSGSRGSYVHLSSDLVVGVDPPTTFLEKSQDLRYDPATGSVSGLVAVDLILNDAMDGYAMNILGVTRTDGIYTGSAGAYFGSTIRLVDVTRADGTALSGTVTFDSGFQLQAVPEPSSVVMFGLGACGLAAATMRRRRPPKSPADNR